jgi:hypothetical protein
MTPAGTFLRIARRTQRQATALRESLARLYQFSTSGEVNKNTKD